MPVNALVVPMQVHALRISESTRLARPQADFSRLPYRGDAGDMNPGVPFLAEALLSAPFEEDSAWLPAGLHLHWALPRALTRGRHDPAGRGGRGQLEFPRVPNRWLVRTPTDWWIVESDALHPDGVRPVEPAVCVPLSPELRERLGGDAPFRYLGRTLRLSQWRAAPPLEVFSPLTAVGWGDPLFAALYTECFSVFGFRDPDVPSDEGSVDPSGPYEVYGWYSDEEQDPVAALAASATEMSDEAFREALRAALGWTLRPAAEDGAASVERPSRLVCVGWIAGGSPEPSGGSPGASVTEVVVGSTAAETVAAWLGRRLAGAGPSGLVEDRAGQLEELSEALLLHERVDLGTTDGHARLAEARHDKAFEALSGGLSWVLRLDGPSVATDPGGGRDPATNHPPAAVAELLAELNARQREVDRLAREQDSSSAQLFSDWCKLQACRYPSPGDREEHPDVDELRRFIETRSIGGIEDCLDRAEVEAEAREETWRQLVVALADAEVEASLPSESDVLDWPAVAAWASAADVEDRAGLVARLRAAAGQGASEPDPGEPGGPLAEQVAAESSRALDVLTAWRRVRRDELRGELLDVLVAQAARVSAAQRGRILLERALGPALRLGPRARRRLAVQPGPRFWRPRDPVVSLVGPDVRPSPRAQVGGDQALPVVALGAALPDGIVAVRERELPDHPLTQVLASLAGGGAPLATVGAPPWNPVLLDWKVSIHPLLPGEGASGRPTIAAQHRLPDGEVDLAPTATGVSTRGYELAGRSILSPHGPRELLQAATTWASRQAEGAAESPDLVAVRQAIAELADEQAGPGL